ncbi:hypothetical protein V8B97DRAFT_1917882 [Scleroderma yunnanense]
MLKEQRWHIDYGLTPERTMLAVPYHAKDIPVPRATFGQPDITMDNPSKEYKAWVWDVSLVPGTPHHVSKINIGSPKQWKEHLFPMFSHNKATIDCYLSQVVFPKEAKEFLFKLSSSSWDLAEERMHVVTAHQFLDLVVEQKPEIHAILDVGAQVLELQNHEFAAAWLEVKPDSVAAIHFNEKDELTVLTQKGTMEPLLESLFAHHLNKCIVYLNEAHTRATDIRFPNDFQAAITLGLNIIKDCLTQACKSKSDAIHTRDILEWVMVATCTEIKSCTSLWAQQGKDHVLHYGSWSQFVDHEIPSNELTPAWLQPDAKTLKWLYVLASPCDVSTILIPNIWQWCLYFGRGSPCLTWIQMQNRSKNLRLSMNLK